MLEQKWYTVADVAELTGLTSRTIRNYLKDGTLHGKKIGVQWRFTEEDINRLFSEVGPDGGKVLKPEDVISGFLKSEECKGAECCFVWDIPFCDEKKMEAVCSEVKQAMADNEDVVYAWEMKKEQQVLRVAASGTADRIEEFAVRMRKFEQLK